MVNIRQPVNHANPPIVTDAAVPNQWDATLDALDTLIVDLLLVRAQIEALVARQTPGRLREGVRP